MNTLGTFAEKCTLASYSKASFSVLLIEEQKAEKGEARALSMELALADPPYHISNGRNYKTFDHYISGFPDFMAMSEHFGELVWSAAHVHIFCSSLQFWLQ